jgi:Na+-translocating ferredoxin:NAD+ oxidoreductase RnfC subunit
LARDFPLSKQEIVARIFQAGVVGAGGAGFPTHVKAGARAEVVIANGCECEPLVQSDRIALELSGGEILEGLRAMMLATGASRGVVAVRESYGEIIEALSKQAPSGSGIEVVGVPDNYPAGDEHLLAYEVTGRAIPQGGIPLDVGVVVSNVNTLIGVRRALEGAPVTARLVSVCGDVPRPAVYEVPIGTAVNDLLGLTGNAASLEGKGILLSGVMMGEVCEDASRPLDKRTGAVVVLPMDNEVMVRKTLPVETIVRRAASVCCQCTLCTELCPRHLMGHAITPHKIMRSVGWTRVFTPDIAGALFCSGCGLCGIYVCPMLLSPDRISFRVRSEMAKRGLKAEPETPRGVEGVRAHRLVPHKRIVERTGLAPYERQLGFAGSIEPGVVRIPVSQHVGAAAKPRVKVGDAVRRGQLVAAVEEGEPGANVHASLDGVVTGVNHAITIERR